MKSLIIICTLISLQSSFGQSLRVMTYNIRYDTPKDGINQWSSRSSKVNALISNYDPDLIGIQEALKNQIDDLKRSFPHYEYVGVGRDDGKEKGEFSAILFKKDRFEILLQKTFWLSETPDEPGSKSWDANITRIVTVAKFRDRKSGKEFYQLNTHFDHIGKEARKNSVLLLHRLLNNEGISKNHFPVILSGDFNSEPSEEPYQLMVAQNEIRLYDSRSMGVAGGTYCGFEVGAMPCKTIDYIFHTYEWKVEKYQVIRDNDGKNYPSDHLPVVVDLFMK